MVVFHLERAGHKKHIALLQRDAVRFKCGGERVELEGGFYNVLNENASWITRALTDLIHEEIKWMKELKIYDDMNKKAR